MNTIHIDCWGYKGILQMYFFTVLTIQLIKAWECWVTLKLLVRCLYLLLSSRMNTWMRRSTKAHRHNRGNYMKVCTETGIWFSCSAWRKHHFGEKALAVLTLGFTLPSFLLFFNIQPLPQRKVWRPVYLTFRIPRQANVFPRCCVESNSA